MEHVGTQVQHCALVDLVILIVYDGLLAVDSDELFDASAEVTLTLSYGRKGLFVQVAETNKDVHQGGRRHSFLINEAQHLLCSRHQQCLVLSFRQIFLRSLRMQYIRNQCRAEVQSKGQSCTYFFLDGSSSQVQDELNQVHINEYWNTVSLDGHLLKDGD